MIVVITNQGAGSDSDKLPQIRGAFTALGAEVSVIEAEGAQLTTAARQAIANGATVVVAAGGDGTMNAVATAVVGSPAVMGVLPLGTLNHFAKDAGIPLALDEAAELIINGTPRTVDVAMVNDRLFLNNSSIGAYPLMVRDRDQQRSRFKRSKWWAMVRASASVFKDFPTFGVRLTVDGNERKFQTPAVMVGNNVYTLDLPMLGKRDALDAGVLSLYAVRTQSRWAAITMLISALMLRLEEHDLFDVVHAEELWLDIASPNADVSFDGEVAGLPTPLHYRIVKGALSVMLPPHT
jgi:diacylglycerol kinase family enzyme